VPGDPQLRRVTMDSAGNWHGADGALRRSGWSLLIDARSIGLTPGEVSLRLFTRAGRQSIGVTVGQPQFAAAARITSVAVQVSFDSGKTWRAATVTGSGGTYRAAFTATAGEYVTLRVTAADSAGGSISETITRAYKIAS
jgi:hypothetical protein